MCLADDTPRYTSEEHPGQSGTNQTRQCRDWNALEDWSLEHTSCWHDVDPNSTTIDTLVRYKFCGKESPYWEYIHAIFGDWVEEHDGPIV
jgi:hypothetical protein